MQELGVTNSTQWDDAQHELDVDVFLRVEFPATAAKRHGRPGSSHPAEDEDEEQEELMRELEKIKKAVESIALVHPSVAFTVRNEITGTLILQTHNTHSVLSNFGMLFAGDKVGRMKNVCIEHSKYKITGYMYVTI